MLDLGMPQLIRVEQGSLFYPARELSLLTIRLKELETLAIAEALSRAHGKKMLAAELMGLDFQRFKRKLAMYGSGQ
jgi:DNA-binding NtrC family response regulator